MYNGLAFISRDINSTQKIYRRVFFSNRPILKTDFKNYNLQLSSSKRMRQDAATRLLDLLAF